MAKRRWQGGTGEKARENRRERTGAGEEENIFSVSVDGWVKV